MPSYLCDANANDVIQPTAPKSIISPKELQAHLLCLKFSLPSIKRTNKETKGRGKLIAPKGRGDGRGRMTHVLEIFFKHGKT